MQIHLMGWLICFLLWLAWADGPPSAAPTTTTLAFSVFGVEEVCNHCECPNPGWLGSQSVESCRDACALKSTHFQHASGNRYDGQPGDNNCACCTSSQITSGDSGWGVKVFRADTAGYRPFCELCRCTEEWDKDWLGTRSISECAQTCQDDGFSYFQHANGLKPDGSRGDNNCACCSRGLARSEPNWGVNVYELRELPAAADYWPFCELCRCTEEWDKNWLGSRSISECAQTCQDDGFSYFQHANGLKPDGSRGDNNCACCSRGLARSEPNWGVNVYELRELPAAADYRPFCELCRCTEEWDKNWLGTRSISECAQTCQDDGFSYFQHANGLKPDGSRGDNNCACCSRGLARSEPNWGVNVYELHELPLTTEAARHDKHGHKILP